jgi:hypothetical protein
MLSLRGTKSRSNLKGHGGEATYADFVYFLQGHQFLLNQDSFFALRSGWMTSDLKY